MKNKKIKMLVYGDSPSVPTGFGTVIKGIFKNLAETGRYDIDIFGINDRGGWKDPKEHPYKIYPAMLPGTDDFYGRTRLIHVIRGGDLDIRPPWDIIFTLQDPFVMEQTLPIFGQGLMGVLSRVLYNLYRKTTTPDKWFTLVSYWPVDSPLKGNWIQDAVVLPDYTIAYTKYGQQEILKADQSLDKPTGVNPLVIYHGTDTETFHEVSKTEKRKFRKKFFGGNVSDETFIVGTIARNQMRKDLPRTMRIFKEFQKRRPDSFLYIHSKERDAWGSLREYARNFDLELNKDWGIPTNFEPSIGYPPKYLNLIYNIIDAHLLNTLGEGWGLPITECMATKTINIVPNITSIPELFNTTDIKNIDNIEEVVKHKIRGIPLKAQTTSSEWATYGPEDYERIRPLTNVDDAVKKLVWVYDNQEESQKIVNRAYEWVSKLSWESIVKQWDVIFQTAYEDLEKERKEYKPPKKGEKKGTKEDEVNRVVSKPVVPELVEPQRDDARPVQQAPKEHREDGELPSDNS